MTEGQTGDHRMWHWPHNPMEIPQVYWLGFHFHFLTSKYDSCTFWPGLIADDKTGMESHFLTPVSLWWGSVFDFAISWCHFSTSILPCFVLLQTCCINLNHEWCHLNQKERIRTFPRVSHLVRATLCLPGGNSYYSLPVPTALISLSLHHHTLSHRLATSASRWGKTRA